MFSEDHPQNYAYFIHIKKIIQGLNTPPAYILVSPKYISGPLLWHITRIPRQRQGILVGVGQLENDGIVDGTEYISNSGADQAHGHDHNDGDKRDNDRILHKPLAFFHR